MPPAKRAASNEQLRLTDSLRTASVNKSLSLPAGQTIVLTDSLFINNDTLRVRGNGAILRADSGYRGPAFLLSPTCKMILLDSLTLQDFQVGILLQQKGLRLKNVRFVNCAVAVQFNHQLPPNAAISGVFAENIFAYQDSVKKK